MTINDRIKQIRASTGCTLKQFAEKIGISDSAVSQIEKGRTGVSDQTIRSICREFGVREEWLRTGEGDRKASGDRAVELKAAVERLFADDSAEFQQALISALLQFDPHGPEWRIVEEIFENVRARLPAAPAPAPDDLPALEDRLRREYEEEKGEAAESAAL